MKAPKTQLLDGTVSGSRSVRETFQKFCEERYQNNLNNLVPVRVQKEKPRQWRQVYDRLAFTVHEEGKDPETYTSLPLF
jgi:hypothetical protein